jgi:hypothetical protein
MVISCSLGVVTFLSITSIKFPVENACIPRFVLRACSDSVGSNVNK